MTRRITLDAKMAAHNGGILAFLKMTRIKPPPKGRAGSLAASFRAGWMSARTAMENGK